MDYRDNEDRSLHHKLMNVEQEKEALKSMLESAADEIEDLVRPHVDKAARDKAQRKARRFRKAARRE